MSVRELATGVASVAVVVAAGCKRPTADLGAALQEPGGEPARTAQADATCEEPAPTKIVAGSGDGQAPMIVRAELAAPDRVQLTFSEGLGPTGDVNPRQFRISVAYSTLELDEGYASAYYQDIGGTEMEDPPLVVLELARHDDHPELLSLRLSQAIPGEVCDEVESMKVELEQESEEGQVGLFLHYTAQGAGQVRDQAGTPMVDMGGGWALQRGVRHRESYGSDPVARLDLLVELDCPADEGLARDAPDISELGPVRP